METNFFVKSHGLGNEYIVLDQDAIDFELTVDRIVQLCNIHVGIGSDGILLNVPTGGASAGIYIGTPKRSSCATGNVAVCGNKTPLFIRIR